jgi:hypothetical protein
MTDMKPPVVVGATIIFEQDSDCCATNTLGQWITVKIEDGGGGQFYVIETERWAFDSPEQLMVLLNKVAASVDLLRSKSHVVVPNYGDLKF